MPSTSQVRNSIHIAGTSVLAIGSIYYLYHYYNIIRKPIVKYGSKKIAKILSKCAKLNELYIPHILYNRHLTLLAYSLQGYYYKSIRRPYLYHSEHIKTPDNEVLLVDWVVGRNNKYNIDVKDKLINEIMSHDHSSNQPIVIMHHGAYCNSSDLPGQDYIESALARGWLLCTLNRRGHKKKLEQNQFNFFGKTDDIRVVTQQILKRRPNARICMIGISAGSGLIARYFGENDGINECFAGIGISPGYNIEVCMGRIEQPYHDMLLSSGKKYHLEKNACLLSTMEGYDECMKSSNMQEFIDNSYKMAGYDSTEEYYHHVNPMKTIRNIKKPVLIINAEDDPICVVENVHDYMHVFEESEGACLALTKVGSHVPFSEGILYSSCWAEKAAFQFLDSALRFSETDGN